MRKPLTSGQKGAQGEKQVARHLRWLSKKQYIVLSDLMLLQGRRLTQIDHVGLWHIRHRDQKLSRHHHRDGTQGVLDAGAARKAV